MSKLVDKNPDLFIDTTIQRIGTKNTKTLHIMEHLNPRRSLEVRRNELSKEIMDIRNEREKLEEEKKRLEEAKQETQAIEGGEESKDAQSVD